MERNFYGFSGCHDSLDPVFSIQEQFEEVLKQHNFKGNVKEIHYTIIKFSKP